jgi:hypothetical protein
VAALDDFGFFPQGDLFFVSSLPQILPQAAATPQPKLQGLRKPGSSNYFSAMNVNEPKVPG